MSWLTEGSHFFFKFLKTPALREFFVCPQGNREKNELLFTRPAYGLGANLNINEDFQVNGEYMQYIDTGGAELSGVSIGFAVLF